MACRKPILQLREALWLARPALAEVTRARLFNLVNQQLFTEGKIAGETHFFLRNAANGKESSNAIANTPENWAAHWGFNVGS